MDNPTRVPSKKSEIEKPEYSKYANLPIRIPRAIDIIPIDNIVSSFIGITYASSSFRFEKNFMHIQSS
jgi:hypothetical protein